MILPLYSLDYISVEVFHYFPELPNHIITTFAIFGPTIGYFDQLYQMYKTRIVDGFSLDNALIMIFTNTLRFFYWSFEPFETYLLGQSIALFILQLVLSLLSLIFAGPGNFSSKEKNSLLYIQSYFRDFQSKVQNHSYQKFAFYLNTFQCQNLIDYCISLILYFILILISFALFTLIFGLKTTCSLFILTANLMDPLISFPMFHRIVISHKIQGVSVILVCQMVIGDILKLFLFIFGKSGWTFVLGATIQSLVDVTTASSFFLQRRKQDPEELEIEAKGSSENLDLL